MTTAVLRTQDQLRCLAEARASELSEAPAGEVVAWVADHFRADAVTMACSMADAMLPHLVSQQLPGVDVLFLDTGYHFPETYSTRDQVARALNARVVDVFPDKTVAKQYAEHGAALFSRDPTLCCAPRTVAPLQKSLTDYEL